MLNRLLCYRTVVFAVRLLRSKMEKTIPRVMSMLNGAADGQPARLEELGLDEGFSYQVPKKFDPEEASKEDLQEEIHRRTSKPTASRQIRTSCAQSHNSHGAFFSHLLPREAKKLPSLQWRGPCQRAARADESDL